MERGDLHPRKMRDGQRNRRTMLHLFSSSDDASPRAADQGPTRERFGDFFEKAFLIVLKMRPGKEKGQVNRVLSDLSEDVLENLLQRVLGRGVLTKG